MPSLHLSIHYVFSTITKYLIHEELFEIFQLQSLWSTCNHYLIMILAYKVPFKGLAGSWTDSVCQWISWFGHKLWINTNCIFNVHATQNSMIFLLEALSCFHTHSHHAFVVVGSNLSYMKILRSQKASIFKFSPVYLFFSFL